MYSININVLPVFILYFLVFYPASSFVTINVSDQTIETICGQTLNYDYCTSFFNNNPSTPKANLNEIAMIAVVEATAQARVNKFILNNLQSNETDPITQTRLAECVSDYTVTLGKLSMAYGLFDTNDYDGMLRWANDAMKMTTKCETRFLKPPTQPCPIENYSQQMIWVNSIVLAILEMLDGY